MRGGGREKSPSEEKDERGSLSGKKETSVPKKGNQGNKREFKSRRTEGKEEQTSIRKKGNPWVVPERGRQTNARYLDKEKNAGGQRKCVLSRRGNDLWNRKKVPQLGEKNPANLFTRGRIKTRRSGIGKEVERLQRKGGRHLTKFKKKVEGGKDLYAAPKKR